MSLNGIDISGWQKGINLKKVPADFVIVKATQGTWMVSKEFSKQYAQAKKKGRLLGVYHYAEGGNPRAEADFFIKAVGKRLGECILFLDWESQDNSTFGHNDAKWCDDFCKHIYKKTKVKPLIYIQASIISKFKHLNYGLWVAQYPNYEKTGFKTHPWNEGAYKCVLRQYTSSGRLSGYSGNLDLNKFYGDKEDWIRYASIEEDKKEESNKPKKPSKKSTLKLVEETMQGKYGTGKTRKKKLGKDFDRVQSFINHVSLASTKTLVKETKEGKYGNGSTRKKVLGSKYKKVQKMLNSSLK